MNKPDNNHRRQYFYFRHSINLQSKPLIEFVYPQAICSQSPSLPVRGCANYLEIPNSSRVSSTARQLATGRVQFSAISLRFPSHCNQTRFWHIGGRQQAHYARTLLKDIGSNKSVGFNVCGCRSSYNPPTRKVFISPDPYIIMCFTKFYYGTFFISTKNLRMLLNVRVLVTLYLK